MKRNIGGFEFQRVGALRVKRDTTAHVVEYVHQLPHGLRLNRYGTGPFCTFELSEAPQEPGVYAIMIGDDIKYVGECQDLKQRFGRKGYGHIAARNCHSDGQATNCKINARVLQATKDDQPVKVWFLESLDRKAIESKLVAELMPPWNGVKPPQSKQQSKPSTSVSQSSSAVAVGFKSELQSMLVSAQRSGLASVRIRSGDLHRKLGGYPGSSHRMPVCCSVMKKAMLPGDRIIQSPPSGTGANLVIEYQLPRTAPQLSPKR